jgi:hypothetical protein
MITPILEQLMQSVAPTGVLVEATTGQRIRVLQREVSQSPGNVQAQNAYRELLIKVDPAAKKAWQRVEFAYSRVWHQILQQIQRVSRLDQIRPTNLMWGDPIPDDEGPDLPLKRGKKKKGEGKHSHKGRAVLKQIHKFQRAAHKLYVGLQGDIDKLFSGLLGAESMVKAVDAIADRISVVHDKVVTLFTRLRIFVGNEHGFSWVLPAWRRIARTHRWQRSPRSRGEQRNTIRVLAKSVRAFDVATGSEYSPTSVKLLDKSVDIVNKFLRVSSGILFQVAAAADAEDPAGFDEVFRAQHDAIRSRLRSVRRSIATRRVAFKDLRDIAHLMTGSEVYAEEDPAVHRADLANLTSLISKYEDIMEQLLGVAERRGARL